MVAEDFVLHRKVGPGKVPTVQPPYIPSTLSRKVLWTPKDQTKLRSYILTHIFSFDQTISTDGATSVGSCTPMTQAYQSLVSPDLRPVGQPPSRLLDPVRIPLRLPGPTYRRHCQRVEKSRMSKVHSRLPVYVGHGKGVLRDRPGP